MNMHVLYHTWGCCCVGVHEYIHTYISFDLGDLGWVLCYNMHDEVYMHTYKDRFILREN